MAPSSESGQVAACSTELGQNGGRSSPAAGELGSCRLAARVGKRRNQPSSWSMSEAALRLTCQPESALAPGRAAAPRPGIRESARPVQAQCRRLSEAAVALGGIQQARCWTSSKALHRPPLCQLTARLPLGLLFLREPGPSGRSRLASDHRPRAARIADPEATTQSEPSHTFIIPTKAFWTNCRYEGQGQGRSRGQAGWCVDGRGPAPLDAPLAPDIDSHRLPAGGDEALRRSRRRQGS